MFLISIFQVAFKYDTISFCKCAMRNCPRRETKVDVTTNPRQLKCIRYTIFLGFTPYLDDFGLINRN